MSSSLFSQSWYRVAELKPKLRPHTQIHRHRYRGQVWFVLQDFSTGRFHRFTPEAYTIIGLMNGERPMQAIWETACDRLGDDMPTQDEVIGLLSQLHQSDVMMSDIIPDISDLHARYRKGKRSHLMQRVRSPLAIKIPFLDPDAFLDATLPLVKPVYTWAGMVIWLIVVIAGVTMAGLHWESLTNNITDQVLSLENLFLLALVYPIIKAIHEFGHAYAVKRWGGEIHEMGIMLLVFMPVPYVDASASLAFRDKYKRILVSAMGMMVELFLASLAIFVWSVAEPGIVKVIAFNVMFIAGVSTLLFNGNPLLKFDAYYMLADLIEIPNLASKSNKYIGYLVKRYLFRIDEVESPAIDGKEARWLGVYAITSYIYRVIIMASIAIFVAGKFFVIGVIFALWTVYNFILQPVINLIGVVFKDMSLYRKRARIFGLCAVFSGLIVAFLVIFPFPYSTQVEGIVWADEKSHVRMGANGFITEVMASSGSEVSRGTPLLRCEDPDLEAQVKVLVAQKQEAEARYQASLSDRTESRIIKEEIEKIKAELERARERKNELVITSKNEGLFLLPYEDDLLGRFLSRGQSIGYVVSPDNVKVRAVVSQSEVNQVRQNTRQVEARMASNIPIVVPARIVREVPAATKDLPSNALSLEGGGQHALDPETRDGLKAYNRLFQFDIVLQDTLADRVGERVFVRFEHNPEPLAFRWFRFMRRLFLSQFDV